MKKCKCLCLKSYPHCLIHTNQVNNTMVSLFWPQKESHSIDNQGLLRVQVQLSLFPTNVVWYALVLSYSRFERFPLSYLPLAHQHLKFQSSVIHFLCPCSQNSESSSIVSKPHPFQRLFAVSACVCLVCSHSASLTQQQVPKGQRSFHCFLLLQK